MSKVTRYNMISIDARGEFILYDNYKQLALILWQVQSKLSDVVYGQDAVYNKEIDLDEIVDILKELSRRVDELDLLEVINDQG